MKENQITKIEYINIKKLTPYEKNTRKHQEKDIKNIATSIEKYGFNDPVGIWGDKNIIVEGHGRVLAAERLGIEEIPCIRLDHLSNKERREYAISHNATSELSEWDFELLELEMKEIDLESFDFEFDFDYNNDNDTEKEGVTEYDLGDFNDENFEHECPRCGFKFNG